MCLSIHIVSTRSFVEGYSGRSRRKISAPEPQSWRHPDEMTTALNTVHELRDIALPKKVEPRLLLTTLSLMRVVSRLFVIVALCFAIGLHWCALQSIAWTTMVIEYSKDAPFTEALAKALDGQHPCSLCHAVQTGKKSEQKNNVRVVTKIDFYCVAFTNSRIHEFLPLVYPADTTAPIARPDSPPTPPPRLVA